MASSIDASTSGAGGVITTADNTGILNLKTAGTNAVTIDASQNVGIGTTSPAVKLDVNGAIYGGKNGTSRGYVSIQSSGDTAHTGYIEFLAPNGTRQGYLGYADVSGSGQFNLWGESSTNALAFATNSTERMRIDSSGNVLVGTTSQINTEKFCVQNSTNVMSAFIRNTRATSGDINLALWSTATRDTNSFIILGLNSNQPGSGQVFNVYTNGNVQNANNSYGAISDIKLKENIVDATPKLDDLCKVKVRQYNLIGDELKQIGVIAQELETVFPKLIDKSIDKDIDGNDLNTTTKSVKYSVFVPILIKAIQEQQAIINDLKARVTALEAK